MSLKTVTAVALKGAGATVLFSCVNMISLSLLRSRRSADVVLALINAIMMLLENVEADWPVTPCKSSVTPPDSSKISIVRELT